MERHIIKIGVIIMGLIGITLSSCYYDVGEELYPPSSCDTSAMSFKVDIAPIFKANCVECHNKTLMHGNVSLDNYGGVLEVVQNGKLIGVINHNPGFPPMPRNQAKLPQCTINKIEAWINQGALNN